MMDDLMRNGWRRVALASLFLAAPAFAGTAKVVLPEPATTSAGIFDSDGRLVRTLWSGRRHEAGAQPIEWDGRTDDGEPADPTARYVVRAIAHNVRYIWEGVIGNTSEVTEGESIHRTIHRAFGPINDMAIDPAGNAFYVTGYNEQQHAIHRFSVSSPQRQVPLAHDDYLRVFRYAATDGTLAYFANVSYPRSAAPGEAAQASPTFVIALRVSDGSEYLFDAGQVEMPDVHGNRWLSAIDYESSTATLGDQMRSAASGLAVQQRGAHLFVAHGPMDEVRVFDKRTGVLVQRISVSRPGDIEVAPDDSMWVICSEEEGLAVARFRYRDGRWEKDGSIREGLVTPTAIGVSPVDGTLVVVDSGTEQLKAFDEHGHAVWTLGRAGGYVGNGPDVTPDKFWFSPGPTYVAFQPDGSFWFGDPGNLRNLHFSAQRQYREQIMYMPATYVTAVDSSDPTRIFRHFLEFRVDYSRPLRSSWELVRNWAAPGLHGRYQVLVRGLRSVSTLRNGRTYATLYRADTKDDEIVELAATGIRPTSVRLEADARIYPDGSVRMHRIRLGSLQLYSRALSEFDAEGNPRWAAPVPLAGIARLDERDPYYNDVPRVIGINPPVYPITDTGIIVSFNPGRSRGFHLGGVRPGDDRWLWRANPSGTWEVDAEGDILNLDGTYELNRGVHYLGNVATAAGRHIVAGYHGEAWNGGQAGQWFHFLDNGLFVGQFGRPVYAAKNRLGARAGSAGNAFSPELVEVGGKVYLWHNDESVHGGIHRWRIEGADRIRTIEASIVP